MPNPEDLLIDDVILPPNPRSHASEKIDMPLCADVVVDIVYLSAETDLPSAVNADIPPGSGTQFTCSLCTEFV